MISPELNLLEEDSRQDTYDDISMLFSIDDDIILDSKFAPDIQLKHLSNTRTKIKKAIQADLHNNAETSEMLELISREYLTSIIRTILDIHSNEIYTTNDFSLALQRQFSIIDAIEFSSLTNNNFKCTILDSFKDSPSENRALIINDIFHGNHRKYLASVKEKLLVLSRILFKYMLFQKIQQLNYNSAQSLIQYLMYTPSNISYTELSNKTAESFDMYWRNLLVQNQKELYLLIQCIQESPKQNKEFISLFKWLCHSPKDAKQTIKILKELHSRKTAYAEDKPNMLMLHLYDIEEKINSSLGKKADIWTNQKYDFKSTPKEMNETKRICESIATETINICKQVLDNEIKATKALQRTSILNKLKLLSRKALYILPILAITSILLYGYYYFYNIESIYSNNFLKKAKISMDATPYFKELKDSTDPVENEIKQKQRLDYINNLNARYFKILAVFLNPTISEDTIYSSISTINLQEELKDIQTLSEIRAELSTLLSTEEWKTFEPMLGPNILSQLRAYGAICNFLVPSLAHYIIQDEAGRPIKLNGKMQVNKPVDEKKILKFEPRVYIDKYDKNYQNIKLTTNTLLKKVASKKDELIKRFKQSKLKEEKAKLKRILRGVAVLETRLKDLEKKINKRHGYIIKHNTYRALLG